MTYYLKYKVGINLKVKKPALAIGSAVHWGIEHNTDDLTEYWKSEEEESRLWRPFREPRFGAKGHGRRCRTWPWSRSVDEALPGVPVTAFLRQQFAANQGGTASIIRRPCFDKGGGFVF
jgi:hypothetical protein